MGNADTADGTGAMENAETTDDAITKIKKIYDYVISHVTYDYANLNNSEDQLKYTAYGALINGTAVCQGYANLFYRLCLEAGIDCRIISGTGGGLPHVWNIVRVGDAYYNVDATWDATLNSHCFFLKSDQGFLRHVRDGDDGDDRTTEIDYTDAAFYSQYPMHTEDYIGDFEAHQLYDSVTPASLTRDGKIEYYCSACGAQVKTEDTGIIARPKTFTLSKTTYTYDGKVKNPTLTIKDSKGKVISSANYSVKKDTGRKLVGTYTYKITFEGLYSGTKAVSFKINPKGTSVVSLTRLSKGFTVKWKKQATQTTGYQIRYSTSSKMTSAKTVTISKNTTVSKTVSKLTAKKKYYVQARTYKSVDGKKYYSDWSATKYVVTK